MTSVSEFWERLTYFNPDEFDSPDAPGSGRAHMDQNFVDRLEKARACAGIPFIINRGGGYRTAVYNSRLKDSVPDSAHRKGCGADIRAITSHARWIIMASLMEQGFNRFGIGRTYIHVDSDRSKPPNTIWHYYPRGLIKSLFYTRELKDI